MDRASKILKEITDSSEEFDTTGSPESYNRYKESLLASISFVQTQQELEEIKESPDYGVRGHMPRFMKDSRGYMFEVYEVSYNDNILAVVASRDYKEFSFVHFDKIDFDFMPFSSMDQVRKQADGVTKDDQLIKKLNAVENCMTGHPVSCWYKEGEAPIHTEEQLYYVRSRGFLGNAILWCGPQGYVCDINKAGKYNENTAKNMCIQAESSAYKCEYIDSLVEAKKLIIDSQYVAEEERLWEYFEAVIDTEKPKCPECMTQVSSEELGLFSGLCESCTETED